MQKITLLIYFLIGICAWGSLRAQAPTLRKHFNALAKSESSYLSKTAMEKYRTDPEVVKTLAAYYTDKNETVRAESIRMTARIGAGHELPDSRRRAVFQLLTVAQDASSVLTEKTAKGLQKFQPDDFGEESRDLLLTVIEAERPHQKLFIELAGYLQMKEELTEMKSTYAERDDLRTSIGLALARSGDEKKLENLMTKIKELEIEDTFAEAVVPLLVYVRQRETFDYLFDLILRNDKNCTPLGPDIPGKILCAYRVVEAVAPYVKDFPVEVGISGDLKTDDYRGALKDVRNWVGIHKKDYELILDKY